MSKSKRRKPTTISRSSKSPLSSVEARKLLWHRYRRSKSWQEVSNHFELGNRGLAYRMAIGTKPDTPNMRVAVRRARARAAKAFYGDRAKLNGHNPDDHKRLRSLLRHTRDMLSALESELLTTEAIGL